MNCFFRRDAEAQVIPPLLVRQHDKPVRDEGRQPLEEDEKTGLRRAEVAPEDMAVRRVDDDRDPCQPGRPAAEDSRLGGVGVNDRGALPAERAATGRERPSDH